VWVTFGQVRGNLEAPPLQNAPPVHAKWGNPTDSDGPPYGRYAAMADIEMDIKEGDIISIIQEHDSGWWQVASRERARAREEERGRENERARERERERKRQRER